MNDSTFFVPLSSPFESLGVVTHYEKDFVRSYTPALCEYGNFNNELM